jgi:hypothetical protein
LRCSVLFVVSFNAKSYSQKKNLQNLHLQTLPWRVAVHQLSIINRIWFCKTSIIFA